jgi:hypothetical protein
MGFQVKTIPYSLYIGKEYKHAPDMSQIIKESSSIYDFVIVPLVHPRLYRTEQSVKFCPLPLTRSEIIAEKGKSSEFKSNSDCRLYDVIANNIFSRIKPSIDLESPVQHIRDRAEYCFIEELELAEYLKIDTVVIDLPLHPIIGETKIDNMARILNQYLPCNMIKIMIRVPLIMYQKNHLNMNDVDSNVNVAWKTFQKFKKL